MEEKRLVLGLGSKLFGPMCSLEQRGGMDRVDYMQMSYDGRVLNALNVVKEPL